MGVLNMNCKQDTVSSSVCTLVAIADIKCCIECRLAALTKRHTTELDKYHLNTIFLLITVLLVHLCRIFVWVHKPYSYVYVRWGIFTDYTLAHMLLFQVDANLLPNTETYFFLGLFLTSLLFCILYKQSFWKLFDAFVFIISAISLTGALGTKTKPLCGEVIRFCTATYSKSQSWANTCNHTHWKGIWSIYIYINTGIKVLKLTHSHDATYASLHLEAYCW